MQRVVDAAHHVRHAVRPDRGSGRDTSGRRCWRRPPPASRDEVDRLQPGLHLLHRLVAGHRAQRAHERLLVAAASTASRRPAAPACARCAPMPRSRIDVLGGVVALDSLPAGVFRPVLLEPCCFQIVVHSLLPSSRVMANPGAPHSRGRAPEPWSAAPRDADRARGWPQRGNRRRTQSPPSHCTDRTRFARQVWRAWMGITVDPSPACGRRLDSRSAVRDSRTLTKSTGGDKENSALQ